MRNRNFPKVITKEPDGSCYRACRKAIACIRNTQGIYKTDMYVYKAVVIPRKHNTVMVTRCYRDYYKLPDYYGKWQEIGMMPIDPKGDYG